MLKCYKEFFFNKLKSINFSNLINRPYFMNKHIFLIILIIFIMGITLNSVSANSAYDIEHDKNFNNEMNKLGFKFEEKVGSDSCPSFSYKISNSDDWDKYNMTGFFVLTGDAYLKDQVHSDNYRPYEVNNVSGYINQHNKSFITQMSNGHYIEYYVDNVQNLDVIVKDYWI